MKNYDSPFEKYADEYDQWFDSERGSRIFLLELNCLRQILDKKGGKWLEVGVGTGRFAKGLGVDVGVDPSPAVVKKAFERGINALEASGENLPFQAASFDGVLLVCTFCFLDVPRKTLRECRRVLKDNGLLVVGFIPSNSPWGIYHSMRGKRGHTFYSSANFYTSDDIKDMVENSGFRFQKELGCILPTPDESFVGNEMSRQTLRDESFVVLSFNKKK